MVLALRSISVFLMSKVEVNKMSFSTHKIMTWKMWKVTKYGCLISLAYFLSNSAMAGPNDAVADDGTVQEAKEVAGNVANMPRAFSQELGFFQDSFEGTGFDEGNGEMGIISGEGEVTFENGVVPAYILQEEEDAIPAPVPGKYAPKKLSEPETVIGTDRRQRLRTTIFPTRAVTYIYFKNSAGSGFSCTGWMIGPNTVATAGHCVHSGGSGGSWYVGASYKIYPGRDGSSAPYGYCTAKGLYSVTGWTVSGNHQYDYAAIKLNCTVGKTTGWFGFKYKTTSLVNEPTIVQGYPGDKPSATHWLGADKNRCDAPRKIYYSSDTAGGMSGGPIWNDVTFGINSGAIAMGVHAYGKWGTGCNAMYNGGTRITLAVYNNYVNWKNLP